MRSTEGRRCGECGHEAQREWRLRRMRPWARRAWIAIGVVVIVAFPAWRGILWSRDRDWTPPLSTWVAVESVSLPNGARLELLEHRHHREIGAACRITPKRGDPVWLEEIRFSLGPSDGKDPAGVTTDVDGDGIREVIVTAWTGGAHCCETHHLFSLPADGSVHPLGSIDARDGGAFEDLDGDGSLEFRMADWSLAYELACFACLELPEVVLRWNGAEFVLAADLMRTRAPWSDEFGEMVRGVRRAGEIDPESTTAQDPRDPWSRAERQRLALLRQMLRLVYSGHEDFAWRLFEETWPETLEGDRETQRAKIAEVLAGSPFREAIKALQIDGLPPSSESGFDAAKRSAAGEGGH